MHEFLHTPCQTFSWVDAQWECTRMAFSWREIHLIRILKRSGGQLRCSTFPIHYHPLPPFHIAQILLPK